MNGVSGRRGGKTCRALTIEYAIIMMVLVTAFIALILSSATLVTRRATDYSEYIEVKAFLDEAAHVFLVAGDKENSLVSYMENSYGCEFSVSENELLVVSSGETLLTVLLEDGVLVAYRYGP